jgi:AmmeMemoRadiSam system protein A
MAPTNSTEPTAPFTEEQRQILLEVARESISYGLAHGRPLAVQAADFHPDLGAVRACFVTLNRNGELRGCIGHLEASQPLVEDVAENAFSAAFRDPRFPPLSTAEWPAVKVHISVLTPAEPIQFTDEQDLLSQLHPGEDGLILVEGPYRGTFLPAVWVSLPRPADFLAQLKRKAGLAADYWSDTLQVSRYRTESFGDA